MSKDPQSGKYKKTLSDLKEGRQIQTDFSKEENRARLKKSKDSFNDYPTEIIIIAVLLILILLYTASNFL